MRSILFLMLCFIVFKTSAQEQSKMLEAEITVKHKDSLYVLPLTVLEVFSGNKRIAVLACDFDGKANFAICSKELTNNLITIKSYGKDVKTEKFDYEFKVNLDLTLLLELGFGAFKNRNEQWHFLQSELGIQFCRTTEMMIEEMENPKYQHCDGRVMRFNDIPFDELYQWKKIDD